MRYYGLLIGNFVNNVYELDGVMRVGVQSSDWDAENSEAKVTFVVDVVSRMNVYPTMSIIRSVIKNRFMSDYENIGDDATWPKKITVTVVVQHLVQYHRAEHTWTVIRGEEV